jgi:hypothetical protein
LPGERYSTVDRLVSESFSARSVRRGPHRKNGRDFGHADRVTKQAGADGINLVVAI